MKTKELQSLKNVVAYVSERIQTKPDHVLTSDIATLQKYLKQSQGSTTQKDFDMVWAEYPNRVGKKAAERHFFATVKNQDDVNRILKALINYSMSYNVIKGFIQGGARWFNEWQDWENPTPAMMGGAKQEDARKQIEDEEKVKFLGKK
jgi:hypothetical protein